MDPKDLSKPSKEYTAEGTRRYNAVITLAKGIKPSTNQIIFQDYLVNFYSFVLSVNTEFVSPQVRSGVAWSPIRLLGGFNFSIMWASQTQQRDQYTNSTEPFNHNGFKKMNEFHNSLRYHQKLAATTGIAPPPMKVLYYNNSGAGSNPLVDHNLPLSPPDNNLKLEAIERHGFIKAVTKEYDRFKTVYVCDYQMEILVPLKQKPAFVSHTGNSNLLPTSESILDYGPEWVSKKISINAGINIDGIPK